MKWLWRKEMPDDSLACKIGQLMGEVKAQAELQKAHNLAVSQDIQEIRKDLVEIKSYQETMKITRAEHLEHRRVIYLIGTVALGIATVIGSIGTSLVNWRQLLGIK